jgi:Papain family cysteine protease
MRATSTVGALVLACVLLGGSVEGVHAQARPTRAMGLILATPDQLRGVPLANTPYSGAELPTSVDLSKDMPPPQDQGLQSSCVAWSIAYALKSYQERVQAGHPIVLPNGRIDTQRVFSPAFVYNQLNQGRDGGVSFIDALNLVRDQGAALWADMPYDPAEYRRAPSPAARAAARRFRIDTWRQVNVQDTRELKAHLNGGFPVLFGAVVDDGFVQARRGYLWDRPQGDPSGTGHAMVLVGYDDARRAFKLMNSWGTAWGDDGYGWVSYEHFRRVAREGYVAKAAVHGSPPPGAAVDATPPPSLPPPVRPAEFAVTSVLPNAIVPDRPDLGYVMRIDGTLTIPPGVGRVDQVVIAFWFDAGGGQKGAQVRSLMREYSTVYGQAACGTAVYPIPPEGLQTTWAAWIPYPALELRAGGFVNTASGLAYQPAVNALVAEAVLYVDNFGIKSAGLIPFSVQR